MRRSLVLAAAVVVAAAIVGAAAIEASSAAAQEDAPTETSSGAVLSAVLGAQGATVTGEVEVADFRSQLTAAETPAERAGVVADAVERSERRVTALESRVERLQTARDNGSISGETYAVRITPLAAEARALSTLVDGVAEGAEDVDQEALAEAGVTPERIDQLQSRVDSAVPEGQGRLAARGLGGEFYADLARAVKRYNEEVASEDLGVLGSYLSGERVNFVVVTAEGDREVVSFRMTEETRVRDLRAGPHPDATIRVTTDEETARRLVNSEEPASEATDAYLEGEIAIDGLGLAAALRWAIINTVLAAFRFLADLFGVMVS